MTASCFTPLSAPITTSYTDGSVVRVGVFSEIWAPAIAVKWKSLAEFSATPTVSASTTDSSALPAASPSTGDATGTATPGPNMTPNSSHTSTIVLASVLPVVFIVLVIGVFVVLRRRAGKRAAAGAGDGGVPELAGNEVRKAAPVEMEARLVPVEMEAGEVRGELDGTGRGGGRLS